MRFENAWLPAGGYWSSPFCRWQGSLSALHPIEFAADLTRQALAERSIDAGEFLDLVLGWTVPSKHGFYGAPWFAGLVGAERATGAMIGQACATSVACLAHAAGRIEAGGAEQVLVVATDKTSNGPHLLYPNPAAPGGKGDAEDWVWDNFHHDPYALNAMIQTAENVAREAGIDRAAQDEMALLRYGQYERAIRKGFHKRVLVTPFGVKARGRTVHAVDGDEGVFPTTQEGLAGLDPVLPDGTVTYGTQTYPADGAAGAVVASQERARALGSGEPPIRLISAASARVERGYMPKAVVPAAQRALETAGIDIGECAVVKTHNPFAVNDVYFARKMDIQPDAFNNYGSSLIYGHPQAPTGLRLIAEALEEARSKKGGYVLFAGCAAGDTASAMVFRVE